MVKTPNFNLSKNEGIEDVIEEIDENITGMRTSGKPIKKSNKR